MTAKTATPEVVMLDPPVAKKEPPSTSTLDAWKTRVQGVLAQKVTDESKARLKQLLDPAHTAKLRTCRRTEDEEEEGFDDVFSQLVFEAITAKQTKFATILIKSEAFKPGHKRGKEQVTALHHAVAKRQEVVVEKLLQLFRGNVDEADRYGKTALFYAAKTANRNMAALLLRNHADVNALDSQYLTPLHVVAGIQRWPTEGDGRVEVATELLSHGAEVNTKDVFGESPLHDAAWRFDEALMRLLLRHGADAECRSFDGQTPRDVLPKVLHPKTLSRLMLAFVKMPVDNSHAIPNAAPRCWNNSPGDGVSDVDSLSIGDEGVAGDVCERFFATVRFFYRLKGGFSRSWSLSMHSLLHEDLEGGNGGTIKGLEAEFVDLVYEEFYQDEKPKRRESVVKEDIGGKIWRWIHVPANQMSWVTDLVWCLTDDNGEAVARGDQPEARKEAWRFLERNIAQRKGVKKGSFTRVPHAGDMLKHTPADAPVIDQVSPDGVIEVSESSPGSDSVGLDRREIWRNTSTFREDQKMALVVPYIDFETEQYLQRYDRNPSTDRYEMDSAGFRSKRELEDRSFAYDGLLGLHKGRTLDEWYYDMLRNKDLRTRDEDQVVFKWFKDIVQQQEQDQEIKQLRPETVASFSAVMATSTGTSPEDAWQNLKSRRSGFSNNHNTHRNHQSEFGQDTVSASRLPRLLMVHQLWLWKLDTNTVITAFPDRYHQGVEDTLFETVRQGNMEAYTKPEQLVENILFETVTFLEEYRYAGLGIHVLEIFESSIAVRSNQEAVLFKKFRDSLKQRKRSLHKQVDSDIALIHEIKDIRDELHLLLRIFESQLDVVQKFAGVFWSSDDEAARRMGKAFVGDCGVQKIIDRTKALDRHAQRTLSDLDYLVQMKQAQSSLEEAETAGRLNNYIMLFTLVTIVFTPLSFLTSLFAIPFDYLPQNSDGEIRVDTSWVTGRMIAGEVSTLGAVLVIGALMYYGRLPSWRETRDLFVKAWKEEEEGEEQVSSRRGRAHGHDHDHDMASLIERSRLRGWHRRRHEGLDDASFV